MSAESAPLPSSRAWYSAPIETFLATHADQIVGEIVRKSGGELTEEQRHAWFDQIDILRPALTGLTGTVCFEFNIPRMGHRVDCVVITGAVVFVIEFKTGRQALTSAAVDQVWDYVLDLKYFHAASHHALLVPIAIAPDALVELPTLRRSDDGVFHPLKVNATTLRPCLDAVLAATAGDPIDAQHWLTAPYLPTPTIVEAARALYANHSVDSITRSDAEAKNLAVTSAYIERLVDEAHATGKKRICFVTGVPGAGKTLVGLNLATRRRDEHSLTHAVFLSGNGPLVRVLQEALTRDKVARRKQAGERVRKTEMAQKVKAFIQNVHHFRDEGLADETAPPAEHVVIFDEAQRAWNLEQTAKFMRQKKGRPNFDRSEPEFLISCMDRHRDWAMIVCLVGGGQEINTGEAGIGAWLTAISDRYPDWEIYVSSRLTDTEYAAGHALDAIRDRPHVVFNDALHLAVSMRSFRAENVSAFVKALLDCNPTEARRTLGTLDKYPIYLTRDLATAKRWLRGRARGSERYGLVASSEAQRLKPHAIDIRVEIDPVHWFLNGKDDTRSSYYLEDPATEFQIQGLELDWVCVTWDGDLRFNAHGWAFQSFRGTRWCNIHDPDSRTYLRNAYRVLLTRARQGIVVFVPPGDPADPTRAPEYYDTTFAYLSSLGLPILH